MALKGIEKTVARFTVETCVYWGTPVKDGVGGWTFADPVEIDCRWDEKQELKVAANGNRWSSQAAVLVNIDLDRMGYLYHGSLADLATAGYTGINPVKIPTAFIIWQFERIPMVRKNDEFVRTAYLYDQG